MQAKVYLDTHYEIGEIDPRLFSGFIEHLGRAVYGGLYDPGNPLSDERGFRRDVLAALKPLRMPLVRYPGGNFVSAYDWRDGIGPREQRLPRLDYAWRSIEPNTFGTDEFMAWCKEVETAPMMVVNLGTAGAKEAAALLEYCNLPAGTAWADRRVAQGHPEPYSVKVWGLGNEMDGPWQAGHVPAEEYARRAQQAGRIMKRLDPSIELVACGSSKRALPTYLKWDRQVLEYCWEDVDYLSAHRYTYNSLGDSAWFLSEGVEVDRIIEDYAALFGYVRGLKRSDKRIYLAFDEWNVWDRDQAPVPLPTTPWQRAPHLLEQVYTLEDALVCAQFLTSFLRHADVVKIACLAQAVNVIAPILTRTDGLLIQSIYYPFVLMAEHARGRSLRPVISSPTYEAGERGSVPVIDAAVSHDPAAGQLGVFLVNRSLQEERGVSIEIADAKALRVTGVDVLAGHDPRLTNSWDHPKRIAPVRGQASLDPAGGLTLLLPPLSFVALRAVIEKR